MQRLNYSTGGRRRRSSSSGWSGPVEDNSKQTSLNHEEDYHGDRQLKVYRLFWQQNDTLFYGQD